MENVQIGQMFRFKKSPTRGRPFVGTVVRRQGMFWVLENNKGQAFFVKPEQLTGIYVFKPYNTRKRRAEAQ
jgi:hypothetical protein